MTVKSKGEWMVETLKRLQLDDLDEPMIARPRGPILGRSAFRRSAAASGGVPTARPQHGEELRLSLGGLPAMAGIFGAGVISGLAAIGAVAGTANAARSPLTYAIGAGGLPTSPGIFAKGVVGGLAATGVANVAPRFTCGVTAAIPEPEPQQPKDLRGGPLTLSVHESFAAA
jgi:hypothetical protein